MIIREGKSVFQGVAIGKIQVYTREKQTVKREKIENPDQEWQRLLNAKEEAVLQLKGLYEKASSEVGEADAAIFEVHQMMLDDLDYQDSIENMIRMQKVNAEYAVAVTADNFAEMFSSMDDDYMKERAADVKDVSERLIRILGGNSEEGIQSDEPVIIAAEDLAPSETVQMDKSKILAFVTRQGSTNSHTAILARTMNIPALIQVPVSLEEINGKMAVVDGVSGKLYIDPDAEVLEAARERQEQEKEKKQLLQQMKGQESVTLSGRKIKLYGNIGGIGDVAPVLENDGEGIGLFRSEFLYLEKSDYPTEEEQFQAYKTVAEMMAGRRVIIRTLDIGADKQVDYFQMEKEENPALGYRAIRICLDRPEIFKTQLRALYRASAYGNIAIMYPMVISLEEVQKIKAIAADVEQELRSAGVSVGNVEQGIMIETPAAVLLSEELAEEVDFFSIGTNDLTQYTLAMDRQNPKLEELYDAHHPAIFKSIQMVIDSAHKAGIWAGICGELGADLSITRELVEMGIDELSVSPSFILPIRKLIRECE